MRLDRFTAQLFEQSEQLGAVRNRLVKTGEAVRDLGEHWDLTFAVKLIDLIRVSLLYEYELLDTANIIEAEFLFSYYGRRIEILGMTKGQIRGHQKELQDLGEHVAHGAALKSLDEADDIIEEALALLDHVTDRLELDILTEGKHHTAH